MTEKNPLIHRIDKAKDDMRHAVTELLVDVMDKARVTPTESKAVEKLIEATYLFVEKEVIP
jgi:hypothetical protein